MVSPKDEELASRHLRMRSIVTALGDQWEMLSPDSIGNQFLDRSPRNMAYFRLSHLEDFLRRELSYT